MSRNNMKEKKSQPCLKLSDGLSRVKRNLETIVTAAENKANRTLIVFLLLGLFSFTLAVFLSFWLFSFYFGSFPFTLVFFSFYFGSFPFTLVVFLLFGLFSFYFGCFPFTWVVAGIQGKSTSASLDT